jgi:hypothetical protein
MHAFDPMRALSDFAPSFETPEASSFAKAPEEGLEEAGVIPAMLSRFRLLVLVIKASWNKGEFNTGGVTVCVLLGFN